MILCETSITDVAAIQSIWALLAQHSRGVDRADAATIAGCYHPDASVDYGFYNGPADKLATILASSLNGGAVTLHRAAHSWVRLYGEQALSESYVMAYSPSHYANSGNRQRFICGRYLDRLTLHEGEWKIHHRQYVLDIAIGQNGAFALPPLSPLTNHCPVGTHSSADAGIALLARARATFPPRAKGNDMTDIAPDIIDRTISTQHLNTLTAAYCRGVDRTDADLLKSLFHDDSIVMSGAFNGNGQDFALAICDIIRAHFEQTFHSTANQWFEIEGDNAIGESYVIAATNPRAEGKTMLTGGRYIDRFTRRKGIWKFSERHFICDWVMPQCATEPQQDPDVAALPLRGKQGMDDPVYSFWK